MHSSVLPPQETGQRSVAQHLAFLAATGLVLWAPLFRGGNRYVPLTALEWLGLAVLLLLGGQTLLKGAALRRPLLGTGFRRWGLLALITLPAWLALIQLTPLPASGGWSPLSQVPVATWASALAAVPIVAMFLMALVCDARSLQQLTRVWVVVAVFQAALGVLQLSGFEALNFGGPKTHGSVGTFANRNHLASFLAMAIPLAMLSLKSRPGGSQGGENSAVSWPSVAMLFVLLSSLFASLSRAGLVVGLMAAVGTGWVLFRPAQRKRQSGSSSSSWMWALIPLLVILVLAVGGLDWLSRFDAAQLEASAREREINRLSAWAAAQAFWPMGSGLGTFGAVFTAHQSPEIRQLVDFAHNEYVQWLLEMGILFPLVLLTVLALIGQRLVQMFRGRHGPSKRDHLPLVCAMGLMAVSLHAWVDFPLRIPANAILAAFLLGVLLREPEQPAEAGRRVSRTNAKG